VRVLLDNCVPWRLAKSITGHDVTSVIDLGWADLTNGRLLDAMVGQFDVLVTVDKGMRFQQRVDDPSCRPRTAPGIIQPASRPAAARTGAAPGP
jgi:hypothetical protein